MLTTPPSDGKGPGGVLTTPLVMGRDLGRRLLPSWREGRVAPGDRLEAFQEGTEAGEQGPLPHERACTFY